MSSTLLDSIVLITSNRPEIDHFGTGFVIYRDEPTAYVLTCAHVVRDVGGAEAVKVNGTQAIVIACGSVGSTDITGTDLAVLRVDDLLNKPPLHLYATGEKGKSFMTAGFQYYNKQFLIRPLQGILGEQVAIGSKQANFTKAWDLKITDDYQLQPGYSGSPVVDGPSEAVIGVVSHRQSEGKKGLALSVEAVRTVWPLAPSEVFGPCSPTADETFSAIFGEADDSILKSLTRKTYRCPMCYASMSGAQRYFIDWNEQKKEFQVKIAYYCSPCHYRFNEQLVKCLPLVIAERSSCSCGSQMSLSDYSIRKSGDELEFEAVYFCEACSTRKRSLISSLMRNVFGIWKKAKKVELGPSGLKSRGEG